MKKAKRRYSYGVWIFAIVLLATAVGVVWWSHNQTQPSGVGMQSVGGSKGHIKPPISSQQNPAQNPTPNPAPNPVQNHAPNPAQNTVQNPAPTTQNSGFEPPMGGVVDSVNIELPRWDSSEKPIYNSVGRYRFVYIPNKRSARWVAYKLTRGEDIKGSAGRSGSFTSDPRLAERGWQSATNGDYKGSGYDKGHLLPSADRSRSVAENRETFRFSNIAPQSPQLNRGPWRLLEEELRRRTADYDTLYIVVGSVPDTHALYPSNATVGNKVSYSYYATDRRSGCYVGRNVEVPRLFYKVVALRKGADFVPQAYVMPNVSDGLNSDFRHYSVSVDSVERLTGIDFFPTLSGF